MNNDNLSGFVLCVDSLILHEKGLSQWFGYMPLCISIEVRPTFIVSRVMASSFTTVMTDSGLLVFRRKKRHFVGFLGLISL